MADSTILAQLEGQWQKIAMLLIWKFGGTKPTILTSKEIEECLRFFAPGEPVFITTGNRDSIEFQIASAKKALEIVAAHEAKQGGKKHG